MNRRDFLTRSTVALLGARLRSAPADEPIIDIHQHLGYSGRTDDAFLAHQRAIGATTTILLPAGRPAKRPSTHDGVANGPSSMQIATHAHIARRCAASRSVKIPSPEALGGQANSGMFRVGE